MWAELIIVPSPRFELRLGIGDRHELMHVQTLVAQAPIERLDERVFNGLAGPNEVELHAAAIGQSPSARDWNSVPWSTVIDRPPGIR
jgi:hypothetical protein